MPQNWKTYKLSELAETNVSTIGKDFPFDEILYLDTGSVTEGRYEIPVKLKTSETPSRAKRIIKHNDLIISTVRPNQKHYGIIKNPEQNLIVSTGFCVITPKTINPEFLYYCLTTVEMTAYLHTIAEGSTTTYPSIKPSVLEELEIELPTLPEQKAIAQILSAIDDKIENNLAINKTLEEMAMALYRHWFVDFGPFQDGNFVYSELGEIPEGWEVKRLADISSIFAGGDKPKEFRKEQNENFNIPIYSNGVSNEGLYGFTDKARVFEESVTVSARGTIGYVCLRTEPYFPIVRLISVIPNREYTSSKFLFLCLQTINIQGNGTTQQQLTVPDFKETKIIIPTIDLINEFTTITDLTYNRIVSNKKENQTLTQLRDTLLPKLISGEVRLKEFKEAFVEVE